MCISSLQRLLDIGPTRRLPIMSPRTPQARRTWAGGDYNAGAIPLTWRYLPSHPHGARSTTCVIAPVRQRVPLRRRAAPNPTQAQSSALFEVDA